MIKRVQIAVVLMISTYPLNPRVAVEIFGLVLIFWHFLLSTKVRAAALWHSSLQECELWHHHFSVCTLWAHILVRPATAFPKMNCWRDNLLSDILPAFLLILVSYLHQSFCLWLWAAEWCISLPTFIRVITVADIPQQEKSPSPPVHSECFSPQLPLFFQ